MTASSSSATTPSSSRVSQTGVTVLPLGRAVRVRTIAETTPAEVVAGITGAVGPSAPSPTHRRIS
jgi:hypothetical protein